jgi:anthranilate phosphoribosyltransferase
MVDTCGTGGDGSDTFNVSTAAALIVAGGGLAVAKHGNRSVSSRSGSADVLEASGVKVDLEPEGVARCLGEVGIGFMFAPIFHPAMKYALGPRKEMGLRTIFNVLGPLTNPAGAAYQVMGVYDGALLETLAEALGSLGVEGAMVVHGHGGLDEISLSGPTRVAELAGGSVTTYEISPEDAGLEPSPLDAVKGGDAAENARILVDILEGKKGPRADMAVLNAAASFKVAGRAQDLREGAQMARDAIASGDALEKLKGLAKSSGGGFAL